MTTPTQPYKVGIGSTCSGAWPVIYEECHDPDTGDLWNRELAQVRTAFVETEEHRRSCLAETWNENPGAFEPTEDGAENIALAYQLAAAPLMAEALRFFLEKPVLNSVSTWHEACRLARAALAAAEVPAELPQADPECQ